MTLRSGALAFAVGVRLAWFLTSLVVWLLVSVVSKPVRWLLPTVDRPQSTWVARFKGYVGGMGFLSLPDWIEYRGNGMFLLKTSRGSEAFDRAIDRLPESLLRHWQAFGVYLMLVFMATWAVILLVLLGATVWMYGSLAVTLGVTALSFDWASIFAGQQSPPGIDLAAILSGAEVLIYALPDIGLTLLTLAGSIVVLVAVWWLIMLPFFPGLALHEFGHYAAIRDAGETVDSYGLLLIGPLLGGAFVEPSDRVALLDADDKLSMLSAGISNSLLWGTVLLATGLLLAGDPAAIATALYRQGPMAAFQRPVVTVLLGVGAFELYNAFTNAIPIGPVDGGRFIQTIEREWWGFDAAIDRAFAGETHA